MEDPNDSSKSGAGVEDPPIIDAGDDDKKDDELSKDGAAAMLEKALFDE